MAATMGIKAFFDGIGRTHVHLVASVVMNIVNAILCWMFIFGHLGAPAMGAPGAGLSAFIATWIGLFIMLGFVLLTRDEYRPLRRTNVSRDVTWSVLKLSIPAAAATVVMMIGFGLFTRAVGRLDMNGDAATIAGQCGGVEAVNSAANTNIVELLQLTFTACMSFGTATATLISQSLGRRDPDEAQRWGWASVRLGVVLFGVVGLLQGVLFTDQVIALFTNSMAVRHAATFPLHLMGVVTPVIAVAMILSEGLFGAGDTKFVAMAQAAMIFGCLLPGAYILGIVMNLSLNGIWIAALIYMCLAAVVMSAKFASGSWKTIRL
jgi:putative MATE family efflux protein